MSFDYVISVALITWLAVISPGADFAVVSRNSALYGRSSGIASSVGIAAGCWLHISYAIFGIAFIIEFFPNMFRYIQIAGAAYLVYIGISTALAKPHADTSEPNTTGVTVWNHFRTGLLTNSLNPKTSIFIISLYSQIMGPETPLATQLLWGTFISGSHFIWFAAIAYFMSATTVRAWVLHRQRRFNLVIGVLLTALGVILFLVEDIGTVT